MVIKPIKAVEKTVDVVDPDAEKILEEEDWMVNADNYDDDVDLMEDDDLLVDDLEQEESSPAPVKLIAKDDLTLLEESHKGLKISSSPVQDRRSEASPAQTPSSRARPSPAKKKRGSPSPIAAGVSLRQRKLMAGRVSTKTKGLKSGPKAHGTSQAHGHVPSDIEQAELFLKNNKKSAKVGSNKPPKISG
ncbi:hypothetical protein Bca52824_026718 [Brassica carinata]|uniref:Uncharacterized protein n=1 Tax=Brassica carinata TaxID=52824 RepID=A0A8X7SK26_BRACI|nr:hypothetical protein Bca52824_026718 [Brassica carinata]